MKKLFISFVFIIFIYDSIQSQQIEKKDDPFISAAVALVNQDSIRSHIQSLQDMGTRFMIANNRRSVAEWIKNKFLSYGVDSVRIDSFSVYSHIHNGSLQYDTTTIQYNVIAIKVGNVEPNKTNIICAHYDDAVINGAPEVYAPGANDNASGVAVLFETARIMNQINYTPKRNIEFIAFAAEELINFGSSGSINYANQAYAQNKQIEMVVNNDAIGNYDGTWRISIYGLVGFESLANLMSSMRTQYTTLAEDKRILTSLQGTDCQPFYTKGYGTVLISDAGSSPVIHTNNDIIDSCEIYYIAEVIKVPLAAMLYSDMIVEIPSNMNIADNSINVFPNPAKDLIYFDLNNNEYLTSYKVMNLLGNIVNQGNIQNNTNYISIGDLAKGMYILQMTDTKNACFVSKFIKE